MLRIVPVAKTFLAVDRKRSLISNTNFNTQWLWWIRPWEDRTRTLSQKTWQLYGNTQAIRSPCWHKVQLVDIPGLCNHEHVIGNYWTIICGQGRSAVLYGGARYIGFCFNMKCLYRCIDSHYNENSSSRKGKSTLIGLCYKVQQLELIEAKTYTRAFRNLLLLTITGTRYCTHYIIFMIWCHRGEMWDGNYCLVMELYQRRRDNSLSPGKCSINLKNAISEHMFRIMRMSPSREIVLGSMLQNPFHGRSILF